MRSVASIIKLCLARRVHAHVLKYDVPVSIMHIWHSMLHKLFALNYKSISSSTGITLTVAYTLNGSDNWNYSWISKLSCSTCIEQCCKLMAGNWTTNLRRLLEVSSSLGYRLLISKIIIRILLFCKLLASSGNESTFWHPWIALKQLQVMNHNVNC